MAHVKTGVRGERLPVRAERIRYNPGSSPTPRIIDVKVGIVPESLLERAALWLGVAPVPLVDLLFSLIKARAIMSGVSRSASSTRCAIDVAHRRTWPPNSPATNRLSIGCSGR
jgi:hypothetical protein